MQITLRKLVLVSAGLAASLATTVAMAETRISVPFNFNINGKVCSAGNYSVLREPLGNFVTLRNSDGKDTFKWAIGPGDPAPTDHRIVLRFADAGSRHILQSVQYGSLITSRLDKKSAQKEHARVSMEAGQ